MILFERVMVVSYRLSIVALSVIIRPQFAIECLRRSNQQRWVNLGRIFRSKGLTDVSQILTRCGKLSYAKEIMSISSVVSART